MEFFRHLLVFDQLAHGTLSALDPGGDVVEGGKGLFHLAGSPPEALDDLGDLLVVLDDDPVQIARQLAGVFQHGPEIGLVVHDHGIEVAGQQPGVLQDRAHGFLAGPAAHDLAQGAGNRFDVLGDGSELIEEFVHVGLTFHPGDALSCLEQHRSLGARDHLDIFVTKDAMGLDGRRDIPFQLHLAGQTEAHHRPAVFQTDCLHPAHLDAGDLDGGAGGKPGGIVELHIHQIAPMEAEAPLTHLKGHITEDDQADQNEQTDFRLGADCIHPLPLIHIIRSVPLGGDDMPRHPFPKGFLHMIRIGPSPGCNRLNLILDPLAAGDKTGRLRTAPSAFWRLHLRIDKKFTGIVSEHNFLIRN